MLPEDRGRERLGLYVIDVRQPVDRAAGTRRRSRTRSNRGKGGRCGRRPTRLERPLTEELERGTATRELLAPPMLEVLWTGRLEGRPHAARDLAGERIPARARARLWRGARPTRRSSARETEEERDADKAGSDAAGLRRRRPRARREARALRGRLRRARQGPRTWCWRAATSTRSHALVGDREITRRGPGRGARRPCLRRARRAPGHRHLRPHRGGRGRRAADRALIEAQGTGHGGCAGRAASARSAARGTCAADRARGSCLARERRAGPARPSAAEKVSMPSSASAGSAGQVTSRRGRRPAATRESRDHDRRFGARRRGCASAARPGRETQSEARARRRGANQYRRGPTARPAASAVASVMKRLASTIAGRVHQVPQKVRYWPKPAGAGSA